MMELKALPLNGRIGISDEQKTYRTVGFVLFCIAAGVAVLRIIINLLPSFTGLGEYGSQLLTEVLFSLPMQLGFLFLLPFLIYKFVLKKSTKEIFEFSNVRKVRWQHVLTAVPLGVCVFFLTVGISTVWGAFLQLLGYTYASSPQSYPAGGFAVPAFLVSLLLTAVLPGFCEEFTMRGGFLTALRKSFSTRTVIIIAAVAFGLFHQNIKQVFYTALFGGFTAFLCIKLKSALPGMIVHFINNGLSVYLDYAGHYGWAGGDIFETINVQAAVNPFSVGLLFVLTGVLAAGLVVLMLYIESKDRLKKKGEIIRESGFDHTHNRVVLFGAENKSLVEEAGMIKEVYGDAYIPDERYRPTLADNAFYIGAVVLTALVTVFSFAWGLFY